SATCRLGAIMKWPDEYGYLFRRTIAASPRCTTSRSSSSPVTAAQKTQPDSSSADLMYSRSHGAQICLTPASLERLVEHLDNDRLGLEALAERRKEEHGSDHPEHQEEGGDEEDR